MILIGVLFCASELLKRKESDIRLSSFFEEEEDFDILFFGSSRVINSIYPMEIWRDFGLTSYNL